MQNLFNAIASKEECKILEVDLALKIMIIPTHILSYEIISDDKYIHFLRYAPLPQFLTLNVNIPK